MEPESFPRELVLFFLGVGVPAMLAGLAAWTGRWKSWARVGRGYRALAMLPGGFGFTCLGCLGVFPTMPTPLALFLFGLAMLSLLIVFLMALLTLFFKDRWYPRWYHRYPGHQW